MISALLLLAQGAANPDQTAHTFEFVADRSVMTVSVAGTFNGWNALATPMKSADGRTWRVTIPVTPRYHSGDAGAARIQVRARWARLGD